MTRGEYKIWFEGFLAGSSNRSIEHKQAEIDRRLPANMNIGGYEMVYRRAITWHKHALSSAIAAPPIAEYRAIPVMGTIGEPAPRPKSVADAA